MRKYLLFVIYILAVLFCSILLILLLSTLIVRLGSNLPVVHSGTDHCANSNNCTPENNRACNKKELTKDGRKLLWQSQILMAVAFTAVEIMHGAP